MRLLRRLALAALALALLLALAVAIWWFLPARTPSISGERAVAKLERVELGGHAHTVLTRGSDTRNPALLFLHGGPGAAFLPAARYYSDQLEEHFVVVHVDQRGAGASCPGVDWDRLTLEQAVRDAIELSERLARNSGPNAKIFLLGHSWGSVVGALAAQRRPELYHAYIGLGQVVDGRRNEELSFQWVIEEARRRGDVDALAELETLEPPYDEIAELMAQRRWLSRYNGSLYEPDRAWRALIPLLFAPEYTLATRLGWLDCFVSSVHAMWGEFDKLDFPKQIPKLEVPVYFFTGRHDWNTPYPLVEEWAATLDAPRVEVVWFEDAGHMIPFSSPAAFQRALIDRLRPLAP